MLATSTIDRAVRGNTRWDLFLVASFAAGLLFLTLPWFEDSFLTKYWFILVLSALGLPTLIGLAFTQPEPSRTRLAARVGSAFLVVALLSALVSGRIGNSLFGEPVLANGLILTTALLGAWALGKTLNLKAARLLELTLVACALVNALVAVVQAATGRWLIAGRAPGLLDNPVYLAPILVGAMWLAICRTSRAWWAVAVCVALLAAGIQASGSRTALLLLPIILVAAAWTTGWRVAGVVLVSMLLGLAIGGVCVNVGGEQTSGTARAAESGSDAATTRLEVWGMATHAIRDRPVLGAGPGRFLGATAEYQTLKLTLAEGPNSQFPDAHNLIVEYAVTTGLIGVALLIAFFGIALPRRDWLSPLGGFAVLALLMHLVEPQHAMITPTVFFALGAAVSGSVLPAEHRVSMGRAVLLVVAVTEAVLITLGGRTLGRYSGPVEEARIPSAYDELETATWQLPFWADPYIRLADLDTYRARRGDPDAAAAAVAHRTEAVERQPERMAYWAMLAIDQGRAGDDESARASFEKALELNPWAVEVEVIYAKLLMSHGEDAEARRHLEHALLALEDRTEADALLAKLGP